VSNETEAASRYQRVFTEHQGVIRSALWGYVERMEEAAREAESAYKAGQEDPEVKAQQDRSLMTNRGFKYAAQMFRDAVLEAREALQALMVAELGTEEPQD
jgi:hypothetical protein